jgi:hypothetical protein
MQKLKPRHCGEGDGPPEEDKEEPGRDTKGRRIEEDNKSKDVDVSKEEGNKTQTQEEQPQQDKQPQNKPEEEEDTEEEQDTESEHAERERTELEDEEDEKNKKRYNLRKRIGRTVYVSASRIFRLDNLRDTDNVIKAMKRGYEVSIGGSFFAGSGGSAQRGQQDGTNNQHDDQETDDDKGSPQQEQDQHTQPQQQKQPRMLTNLARYNTPRIKDNENVTGKRNQCNRHQMAEECEKKRDRITQSDMQHREKQQRLMETIRSEMYATDQESSSNTTTPTSSPTTSPSTSRETSPSPTRTISRRERVDKNLQDISTQMQQTGKVMTAAGSALLNK